ncbi:ABC transporter permease [Protofrankia coriariae]|uniref:ABC transporter permease n=1 Tax=Protofrankia coriariae TaxID=1562887 RepID=A0ABR5F7C5_9ACTN|nr:ABC transporter permease [Protofrankia coriariae]
MIDSGVAVRGGVGTYLAVARYSARRYAGYRAATAAGVFTNTVFGIIRAYVLLQVWHQRPGLGGYDTSGVVTFVFLGQGLITSMALFGGGIDLPERIRSGAVAMDMARPVGFQTWWLADDAGRAAIQLLTRGLPPMLVAALLFDLRLPTPASPAAAAGTTAAGVWGAAAVWGLFAVSVVLGFLVSFGLRYLIALATFWLLDQRGLESAYTLFTVFFSGISMPLTIMPGVLRDLAEALPFAAMMQVPADVLLGNRTGASLVAAIAFQVGWAVVLLAAGRALTAHATRKLVVQGG